MAVDGSREDAMDSFMASLSRDLAAMNAEAMQDIGSRKFSLDDSENGITPKGDRGEPDRVRDIEIDTSSIPHMNMDESYDLRPLGLQKMYSSDPFLARIEREMHEELASYGEAHGQTSTLNIHLESERMTGEASGIGTGGEFSISFDEADINRESFPEFTFEQRKKVSVHRTITGPHDLRKASGSQREVATTEADEKQVIDMDATQDHRFDSAALAAPFDRIIQDEVGNFDTNKVAQGQLHHSPHEVSPQLLSLESDHPLPDPSALDLNSDRAFQGANEDIVNNRSDKDSEDLLNSQHGKAPQQARSNSDRGFYVSEEDTFSKFLRQAMDRDGEQLSPELDDVSIPEMISPSPQLAEPAFPLDTGPEAASFLYKNNEPNQPPLTNDRHGIEDMKPISIPMPDMEALSDSDMPNQSSHILETALKDSIQEYLKNVEVRNAGRVNELPPDQVAPYDGNRLPESYDMTPPSTSSLDLRPHYTYLDVNSAGISLVDFLDPSASRIPHPNEEAWRTSQRHLDIMDVPEDINTRAVVNTLRTLQEKVGKLEVEKAAAKERISELESELGRTKGMVLVEHGRLADSLAGKQAIKAVRARRTRKPSYEPHTSPSAMGDDEEEQKIKRQLDSLKLRSTRLLKQLMESKREAQLKEEQRKEVVQRLEVAQKQLASFKRDLLEKEAELRRSQQRSPSPKKQPTLHIPEEQPVIRPRSPSPGQPLPSEVPPSQAPAPPALSSHDNLKSGARSRRSKSEMKPRTLFRDPYIIDNPVHSHRNHVIRSRNSSPARESAGNAEPTQEKSFLTHQEIEELQREIDRSKHEDRYGGDHTNVKSLAKCRRQHTRAKGLASRAARRDLDPQWRKVDSSRPKVRPYGDTGRHHARKELYSKHRPGLQHRMQATRSSPATLVREMPFVVGKVGDALKVIPDAIETEHYTLDLQQSVSKSHSVTANLQAVFSLLKKHNPALCSVCSRRRHDKRIADERRDWVPVSARRIENDIDDKDEVETGPDDHASLHESLAEPETETLENVLEVLEEEFNSLKSTYKALVDQYDQLSARAENTRVLRAVGDELREVIRGMESKGDQIAVLRDVMRRRAAIASNASPMAHRKSYKPRSAEKSHKNRTTMGSPGTLHSLGLLKGSVKVREVLEGFV
ncbi:hypothetical protein HDU85_005680 [Gaertneriomyces sp. JEL0708]|nr:hypothetical protein HDU85_005680 [Gaertneriomyces sp. JEL0708]